MCKQGVNADQMKLMLGQANDALAMAQQWLEQIHHLADQGGMTGPSVTVAQATVLIGEARGKLESATAGMDAPEEEGEASIERV
jgi:hypothetical protein